MLKTQSAGEEAKQIELLHTARGNADGTTTLETSWTICYKVKHTLTIRPSKPTPGY